MDRLIISAFCVFFSLFPAMASNYAVVVQNELWQQPAWRKVCDALLKKHKGAILIKWNQSPKDALSALQKNHPRYTCFVASYPQSHPAFVAQLHRLTRQYDDDIYTDTRWGILTGFDAASALKLAEFNQPITVKKTSSGTELAMEMMDEAIWYDELVKHKTVSKIKNAKHATEGKCPQDTTRLLAQTLTDWKADLFVTSGHGFPRGWQIGFSYKNGFFQSKAGQMFGKTLDGNTFPIQSDHPRVYLPIGNCSIGHIESEHSFTLAMMRSVGVKGMIGYTVPTWYGYAGWGMLDYFVEQPGRYTLNEAFIANQLALVHRLETSSPGSMKLNPAPGKTSRQLTISPAAQRLGVSARDLPGLLHDRDVLAYFGDPALQARMSPRPTAYQQKLTHKGDEYTLVIQGNRGEQSFATINKNGSQRGGRPIVAFFPERINGHVLLDGKEYHPVITDDFILIPNPGSGTQITVKWKQINPKN